MKINKRKSYRNHIVIAAVIVALAAGLLVAYLFLFKNESRQQTDKKPETNTTSTTPKKTDASPTPEEDKTTPQNTDTPPTQEENTTSNITLVASARQVDSTIYLRGGANTLLPSDGVCYALLKSASGQTIRKDTELLDSASTTDCKTIAVDKSELSAGSWTYTLHYESSTIKGLSQDVAVEIN